MIFQPGTARQVFQEKKMKKFILYNQFCREFVIFGAKNFESAQKIQNKKYASNWRYSDYCVLRNYSGRVRAGYREQVARAPKTNLFVAV